MIKIFISVRNRLEITKKCIEALERHSTIPHDIYIYDNSTNHRVREHWEYFYNLYKNGLIVQCTFNTDNSTFNAFSKAVSCNQFGQTHMLDPKWNQYDFLTILDNDCIVTEGWDEVVKTAWKEVRKSGLDKEIRIVGQLPGGIKSKKEFDRKIAGYNVKIGKYGGSGFWNVNNSFFKDVGFLDISKLVGHAKRHDQSYWEQLELVNKGKEYILGIDHPLVIHCGGVAGSVCNTLTRNKLNKNKLDLIKFEDAEKKISDMSFTEFYKMIKNDKKLAGAW